jgi:quercetin dioxygenase-like cupin family protein
LLFLAIKDTRSGIIGPPVDGKYDGPNCFPGFGSRSAEPRLSTAQVMEQSRDLPAGPGKRYVYNMLREADSGRSPASAEVTTDAQLRLPPGITGKLLSGERLHVGVLRLAAGAVLNNYRRDNEQFVFVVEGELDVELGEDHYLVPMRSLLHIPAGTPHEMIAQSGAIIVIAQDKGEPV